MISVRGGRPPQPAIMRSSAALNAASSCGARGGDCATAAVAVGGDHVLIGMRATPLVLTEPASSIGQTTATLNATVNPRGLQVGECKLEYGTTRSYGASVPCAPAPGSGSSAVAVSASVSGLREKTTYHFRVVASNLGGTSFGSRETFKTLRK